MTDPDKLRLFTALPVSVRLSEQAATLPRGGLEAKWNKNDDLHITLRFLGEVEPERLPEIQEALARVRRPAFYVEVRGMDRFDQKREAILYAVIESTRQLNTLCAEIGEALTPLGFDFGTRPYVPHVTLARLKSWRDLDTYIAKNERKINDHWQATHFGLMQSTGLDEGERFLELTRYPLQS
mgnify:CR=1 FL=1